MTFKTGSIYTERDFPWVAGAVLTVIGALGVAGNAHAFYEDVCYGNDGITSCLPLPASCSLTEPVSQQCLTQALVTFAAQPNAAPGRSTVHTDVTYLIAQAVGFPAANAYWIAAYDEATDLGNFVPRNQNGVVLRGYQSTATIDGLVRGNLANGGVLFHFNAPRNNGTKVPGDTDGLHPEADDADTEVVLAHVRRWAMYEPNAPECTGGLTVWTGSNYTSGDSCYTLPGTTIPGTIAGSLLIAGQVAFPFNPPTGPQIIAVTAGLHRTPVSSEQFDTYIANADQVSDPAHAADARLGIYLHTLADRVSHHVCTDASVLTDPVNGVFSENMINQDCSQPLHVLRHMYETGVNFGSLSDQDKTTSSAIEIIYDELVAFAQKRGVLNSKASDPGFRQALLNHISEALQKTDAANRISSLTQVACDYNLTPFPGASGCSN